ncbi:hypothetical protein [Williamsia herbipolensis]|nr:hypothetical protein [Williamsia herbipolensis]
MAADSIYGEVQEAFAEMKRLRKVPRKLWTDARTLRYLNAMATAGRVFD